eukprot:7387446-Prymnesium_polylepis.2
MAALVVTRLSSTARALASAGRGQHVRSFVAHAVPALAARTLAVHALGPVCDRDRARCWRARGRRVRLRCARADAGGPEHGAAIRQSTIGTARRRLVRNALPRLRAGALRGMPLAAVAQGGRGAGERAHSTARSCRPPGAPPVSVLLAWAGERRSARGTPSAHTAARRRSRAVLSS